MLTSHLAILKMSSEEKILKLIGYESSASPQAEAIAYLHKLRVAKKETLKKDSVNLKDDLNNNDLKTQEIAFANYPAFIKTRRKAPVKC